MSGRHKLLQRLSAIQFSLWELHLYLTTHPNDMQALAMHEKYEKKLQDVKSEFEEEYGPITPNTGEGIEWIKNPWPWDIGGADE